MPAMLVRGVYLSCDGTHVQNRCAALWDAIQRVSKSASQQVSEYGPGALLRGSFIGVKTDFSGDFQRPNLMIWEILDWKFFQRY